MTRDWKHHTTAAAEAVKPLLTICIQVKSVYSLYIPLTSQNNCGQPLYKIYVESETKVSVDWRLAECPEASSADRGRRETE